ncbi:MAG TPA: DNA-formamidopyrimidine glycosylase family protein, partial [Actinomycetota bacterium]|nr:DNA-formamidopyrimidine glycosylase family protein [Actinomycetota bacterium]
MPELPDVEAERRRFAATAAGRRVRRVAADPAFVRNASPEDLDRALRGRRLGEPRRLGKWLLCPAGGPVLLLHFGMTGRLDPGGEPGPYDRLVLELEGSALRLRDVRKLGGAWLARDEDEARRLLRGLGPDALEVDRATFLERLAGRRGGAKALLLDQGFVAGVGNLLADEILWRARLHPRAPVVGLDAAARAGLHRAMRDVLRAAVARIGRPPPPGWLLSVRGEPGARCPRCRTPLARIAAAGRTTYLCP